jgi:branched-chain amino acid transport system permease protein
VVAFPRGIVGMLETIRNRRRPHLPKPLVSSPVESAE